METFQEDYNKEPKDDFLHLLPEWRNPIQARL